MAILSGARTNAILQSAPTWGTAVQGGAGDKLRAEISPNFNVEALQLRQIGSGVAMIEDVIRGNLKPSIGLTLDAGYRNCLDILIAHFMGTSGAPVEQTASQADYKHTITFNPTLNPKWLTHAYETSTTTVIEYPSCAVRSLGLSLNDAPGILEATAELIANNVVISSTVNTNASLQGATNTDVEPIAYSFDDTFRMNAASGSTLSGSDQFNIVGFALNLTRPQECQGEIRAAAGNASPVETGLFEGTLQITMSSVIDHTRFSEWLAETAMKCSLNIQGTQIGSGVNKAITINIPRMKYEAEPNYSIAGPGVNPYTATFRIIKAQSNPSGMTSTYPYFEMINGLSTSLLA